MGVWEGRLPAIAMVWMQVLYAAMALLNRAALVKGMSPRVFIFYRQTIATLVICPIAYYFSRGRTNISSIGFKSFLLIFVTAFIGVTMNQNMYFEGLYLASSSVASATANLIPAVTFVTAVALGLEEVNAKTLSSVAKILGTILCVGGAISMATLRGPKLLNTQLPPPNNSLLLQLVGVDEAWLLGCLCLFASSCCWSLWLILQVPITAHYSDHLSLSGWMCFLSMLQTGAIALIFERDPVAWNLSSALELTCCFFSGILGSGVQFFVQAWCISRRGPFYAAMFTPLATVITTVLACIILHEQIYLGSLLGAVAVIVGLYVVIWGKSEELKQRLDSITVVTGPDKIAQEKIADKIDLEQPLLTNDDIVQITPNKDDVACL